MAEQYDLYVYILLVMKLFKCLVIAAIVVSNANIMYVHAANGTLMNTISVFKDGTVPFDSTTYTPPTTNAGKDASATNWVVRIVDNMLYKWEISCNDADCANVTITFVLDPGAVQPKQRWTNVPTDCLTWSISSDKQTLMCTVWNMHEWQNLIIYPQAIVTQNNRNGDLVRARISTSSPTASSPAPVLSPTTMTTAGFGVDLVKTLKPPFKNAQWDIIYTPDADVKLDGSAGGTWYMVTYRISANYNLWSAFVSGNTLNQVSYTLSDTFAYAAWYLGTWALFAWCSVVWANASVVCPAVGTPLLTTSTSRTFPVSINNIDITNPVDGNKIFSIDVKYWIPVTDIRTDGTPLTNRNDVVFSWGSIVWPNSQPISVDNIPNPSEGLGNNGMDYPMFRTLPVGWSTVKSFFWYPFWGNTKNGKKKVAIWEIISFEIHLYNEQTADNTYHICDNIDTNSFEFIWLDSQTHNSAMFGVNWPYIWHKNPYVWYNNWVTSFEDLKELNDNFKIEYSNIPFTANTTSAVPQRNSTCEDDMNWDWVYDWTVNPSTLPWGTGSVTKIRLSYDHKYAPLLAKYGNLSSLSFFTQFLVKIKSTVNIWQQLPNFMISIRWSTADSNWRISNASTNLLDTNYSLDAQYADRVTVVWAKASLTKSVITPSGSSIINPGDSLTYTISPSINWWYIPANGTVPVTITDYLPGNMSLVSWTWVNCGSSTITLTSAPTANPLVWTIIWSVGQPLCQIQYVAKVADSAGKWDYINTARIDVCDPALANDCGILDKEVDAAWNDTIAILAVAGVSIVAKWNIFDVKKDVPETNTMINTPFSFNLSYANLGTENFGDTKVLDILPYVGDRLMTGTSWPNTSRRPGSEFAGTFQLTSIWATNWEYGFEVTDGDPTLIANDASSANTAVTWTPCTDLANPSACLANITAVRRNVPASAVSAGAMRKSISLTLTPTGNMSGDIYTNSFSAKVPEMSFPVISNDVSVQVVAGSIWDTVRFDTNSDGIQDTWENWVAGIPVTLKDSAGNIISTAITDSLGEYLFTWLAAGTYHVSIVKPSAWTYTYDLDSQTTSPDGDTIITITKNLDFVTNHLLWVSTNLSWDFGVVWLSSSLAGNIYLDNDMSKWLGTGDIGISWLIVYLNGYDLWGNFINITTTANPDWSYLFSWLTAWVYSVYYANDTTYIPYTANTGTINGQPVWDVNYVSNLTNISLWYGQNSINNNFWLIQPASIAGTIYHDLGKDGALSTSDPLLSGQFVFIRWVDIFGNDILITTTTDTNGAYSFTGVTPWNYTVSYSNIYPNLSAFGSSAGSVWWSSISTQVIWSITLKPADAAVSYDFGLITTTYKQTLAGKVYIDNNMSNGLNIGDNMYSSGAIVYLSWINASGAVVYMSTVAWVDGNYKFTNLQDGVYSVYLDTGSVAWYIHSTTNTGTIWGQNAWTLNNLVLSNIKLWVDEDSIDNNFWLSYIDLTVNIQSSVTSTTAWSIVTFTINYSNQWIWISKDTVIDLSALSGLNLSSGDLQHLIWSLNPGQSGSFTISVMVANTDSIVWQSLPVKAHIYSTSTPERDILTNYSQAPVVITADKTYSIGGNIYIDTDNNNTKSSPDTVYMSGASITLAWTDRFGNVVNRNVLVWSDGMYIFSWLIQWNYNISITNTNSSYTLTTSNAGMISGFMIGSGYTESGSKNAISNIYLTDNGISYNFWLTKNPAPVVPTWSFSWHVFFDTNNNAMANSGEIDAGGVTILVKSGSVVIMTLTSNASGYYGGVLPIGNYTIEVVPLAWYTITTTNPERVTIVTGSNWVWDDGLYKATPATVPNPTPSPVVVASAWSYTPAPFVPNVPDVVAPSVWSTTKSEPIWTIIKIEDAISRTTVIWVDAIRPDDISHWLPKTGADA